MLLPAVNPQMNTGETANCHVYFTVLFFGALLSSSVDGIFLTRDTYHVGEDCSDSHAQQARPLKVLVLC